MGLKTIVVSSGNINKIKEIKDILKDIEINIVSKDEIGLKNLDVVEDKKTLEENAIKKAKEISKHTDSIVIADDSGLFVDALDGAPGVHSARYAGEEADYRANNKKLLQELKNIPLEQRTAKFVTVIAIVLEDKTTKVVKGECQGKIILESRGEKGFGYDPLFIPDGYTKTFSELDSNIKNTISHRANALENLKKELKNIFQGMN